MLREMNMFTTFGLTNVHFHTAALSLNISSMIVTPSTTPSKVCTRRERPHPAERFIERWQAGIYGTLYNNIEMVLNCRYIPNRAFELVGNSSRALRRIEWSRSL